MTGRELIVLLLAGSAVAQFDGVGHRLRVRVAFTNGVCDASTHVKLISHSGPVADATPNDQCEVDFGYVPDSTYHVSVSGQNIVDTDNIITTSAGSNDVEVKIKRAGEAERGADAPMSASVSAADLRVPAKAQKEFDKANELIARNDLPKAVDALNRSIALYPSYANAYNNLGVIYARLGDRARERDALNKAISINDHFAPAYVNLGRMNIATGDFASAETALNKAASYDPLDAMTFVLLAYSQFMAHHADEAIATSRIAHRLAGPHAFAHQVAARSFEQRREAANAIAELELFLKEEPSGPRADSARKELAQLQAIPH